METATNPQTGERVFRDAAGQWSPLKTATNPQTGDKVYLEGGAWKPMPAPESSGWDVAAEFPRQLAKGAQDSLNFANDVFEAGPLGMVKDVTEGRAPVPFPLRPLRAAIEAYAGGESVGGSVMAGVKSPFTEFGAQGRLRKAANAAINKYTDRQLPKTDNPLLEGGLTASRWLGGSLGVGGLAPAAAMAAGAGAGRGVAEAGDFGEGAGLASEFAGAILGLTKGGASKIPGIARRARDWITRAEAGEISPTVQKQVLTDIKAAVETGTESVDDVVARVETRLGEGDIGTLGGLADDPAMSAIEANIRTGAIKQELAGVERAAQEQAVGRIRGVVPGDTGRAREPMLARAAAARGRAGDLEAAQTARSAAQTESMLGETRAARAAATEPLAGYGTVEDAGRGVSDAADNAAKLAKDAEAAAWAEVPADELVPTAGIKQSLEDLLGELKPAGRRAFESDYATQIRDVKALGDVVEGAELSELRSLVSKAQQVNDLAGTSNAGGRFVTRLTKAVEEALDAIPGGEAYRAARQATRDRYEIFTEGPLGRTRKAAARAGTPAVMGERLTPSGARGADTAEAALAADRFTPAGETRAALEQSLRAQFAKQVDDGKNVDGWLAARQPTLKRFPELEQEFATTADTLRAADIAETSLPAAQKAREGDIAARAKARTGAVDASATAEFGAFEDGVRGAKKVLTSAAPASAARELVRTATRAGGGALPDLKASFIGAYLDDVVRDGGGLAKGVGDKLARYQKTLGAVLSPAEVAEVERLVSPLEKLARAPETRATALEQMKGTASAGNKLMVAITRVMGSKILGAATGTPLVAANISSAAAKRLLEALPKQAYTRLMTDYVLHPQKYVDDMRRLGEEITPAETVSILERMFSRPGAVLAAGGQVTQE